MLEDLIYNMGEDEDGDFMPILTVDDENLEEEATEIPVSLPVLVLKNTVLFPGIVIPITVGRDKSIRAIQKAQDADRIIAVISQKDSNVEQPGGREGHPD